jgi:TusE/DsrC/DsvC family sulfur relay protein
VHVDAEGFLTGYDEWSDDLAQHLAAAIGIELTEAHWKAIRFCARTSRPRVRPPRSAGSPTVGGIPTKELFVLFPKKPAKKMAYIAGLPKPHGCV